jgi:menaquinone-9 beta-reductase
MPSADVIVVGAGPAGAATAVSLARSGREVVVVDKARFPRDKICGDGLTAGALRLLEGLGLDPGSVASWQRVDDVVVRGPSGHEVTFPLPRGQGTYAAVARRADLDAALVELARSAGVKVLDGHACDGVVERPGEVEVTVSGVGALTAGWLVAADGMWSPVRRHLGLATPGYRGEWHAFRQYFTGVGQRAASDLHVWFEPDLLPGYAWSFPLPGNRANVGFGILRGGKVGRVQEMAAIWPELLERPHVREALGAGARPESPHRAWPIPARIDRSVLTGGRTLFVGDAAAATDPLTGEGIGQALLTGVLAARAIVDRGPDAASVTAAYRHDARRALVADHRMSVLLGRAVKHRKGVRIGLRLAGATGWTRRQFGRWLFEDYPRAAVVTPRRWRRDLFTRPGAYRVP